MTVGEMLDRIVAFKRGHGEGRWLRDVDPDCATALNHYWEALGPAGAKPCKLSIDYIFNEVERRMKEAA